MEPDMAIDLILNNDLLKQEEVGIKVLIGDDDSSTTAALRRLSTDEIIKWSDYNHSYKSLQSSLYSMKLSAKLMEYFSHCFSHAVRENKGNAAKVDAALRSVIPHAFGDHTKCGTWCESEVGTVYVHKNLPHGKPLQDFEKESALKKIFSKFADNADKICNCGSTQANEAFNHCMSKKCPKSQHFSSSQSISFRLAATVCQTNIGTLYINKVYEKLDINSGKNMLHYLGKKDVKRVLRSTLSKSKLTKKRRLELKRLRSSKIAANNRKEGITYESGVALEDVSSLLDICGSTSNVVEQNINSSQIVIFDIEPTGLTRSNEIIQLGACTENTTFNVYIVPSKPVSKTASEMTGLKLFDGDLFLKGEKVQAHSAKVVLMQFLQYLNKFKQNIILMAHNGFSFDVPRLLALIQKSCNFLREFVQLMHEFTKKVAGFSDSLRILKKLMTKRVTEKKRFSIEALTKDFLPNVNTNNLHNAACDVETLQLLLNVLKVDEEIIKKFTKSIDNLNHEKRLKIVKEKAKHNLQDYKKVLSSLILNKMILAEIDAEILKQTFAIKGNDGIRILFFTSVNGKPSVTTNKKIIYRLCQFMTENV